MISPTKVIKTVENRNAITPAMTEFESKVTRTLIPTLIFLEPIAGSGYFNFEFNCLGDLRCSYYSNQVDTLRQGDTVKLFTEKEGESIKRFPSLKPTDLDDERAPQSWTLEFAIPFTLFTQYLKRPLPSEKWRGNLYKCGDETAFPHWISWTPLDELNFHLPKNFGNLEFDPARRD